jgi:hypothetical protein
MKPVFFSYSRQDSEFALRLGKDLRAAGMNIWLDQIDIPLGERWDAAIETVLSRCSNILVILSPASVESTNVMDEVSYALEEQKRVIPILLKDCEIPFRLRRLQHTDFRADYDTALGKLLQYLSALPPETKVEKTEDGGSRPGTSTPASATASTGARGRKAGSASSGTRDASTGRVIGIVIGAAFVILAGWMALKPDSPTMDGAQTELATANAATTAPDSTPVSLATAGVAAAPKEAAAAKPAPVEVRPGAEFGNEPRIRIVNANSQLCLTVAGGSKEHNAEAVQYPCDDHPSRFWSTRVVPDTDMATIRNLNSGLCLTIAGGSAELNTPAVLYPCDGDPSRNWRISVLDHSTIRLVNVRSKLCLTIAGGSTENNLTAVQYECDGHPSRDWQLRRERD